VLGDYDDDFAGTPVTQAHGQFLTELTSIEDEIKARNKRRPEPYHYLQPSLIPNSTNI
jgi:arachidonate 15-lipoxygenase